MQNKVAIVVTSISQPNTVLKQIATEAMNRNYEFIVVGDTKSPTNFSIDGCTFLNIDSQLQLGLAFAEHCPTSHYSRKNIGYLLALSIGANVIIETDDDNFPRQDFFNLPSKNCYVPTVDDGQWVNVYRFFSDQLIWPRGFPLNLVKNIPQSIDDLPKKTVNCPIQQGLADENPDVDAIYRLTLPLPQSFKPSVNVAVGKGSCCPFNSQNTTWLLETFPLLYLPSYCSFRMTDIWRSFVAQRIAWENDWYVLFHEATVRQERNDHNLMQDFADEVPGYLHNQLIVDTLNSLALRRGCTNLFDNMRKCYKSLVELQVIGSKELALLEFWLTDVEQSGWVDRLNLINSNIV